jgi:hypothetical protein
LVENSPLTSSGKIKKVPARKLSFGVNNLEEIPGDSGTALVKEILHHRFS